ncbi:putative phosphomevalonate kinase [Lachnellula hyalina]|uniref:Phosphomevalonate kinase n=1 Tax=Lachnellula hyalina TaxID=1316788 RepID=A0A8H8QZ44_9HELO|nr:putative phosphomevalonate kinase [Lachnellula hyalina]TVY25443.1 putative phosphomevalonate kinase [Lachnellula hyalina]
MVSTAVSAPGKVLLAGGYLVLDRAYTGLVFGLSARIHVLVHDIDASSGVELSEIVVQSPQFLEATWNYGYHLNGDDGGVNVTQLQGNHETPSSRNPFVETALLYTLTYISTILPKSHTIRPAKITILADNDYYSHSSSSAPPPTPKDGSHHHFTSFNVRLQDAHKTGLGSSAALVTAFTGALLSHYLPPTSFSLSSASGRAKLHNLAQAAHCAAQGKVGSGFDVAAAVFGTCVYRRFSPSILSRIGEAETPGFATRVKSVVEDSGAEKWDTEVSKGGVTIPSGMALVMCDVDCGSQTVGMVKKVLEWRKSDGVGSKVLWDELQERNVALGRTLDVGDVGKLEDAFGGIREKIREMGEKSGVPIEPVEQTELLDAVTKGVEGVKGGVVPGAGGYDAIVLLVKDDEDTLEAIKTFLVKWSEEKKSNVKLLGAKGELEGAKKEDIAAYGIFA